jgi:hypothetical protein
VVVQLKIQNIPGFHNSVIVVVPTSSPKDPTALILMALEDGILQLADVNAKLHLFVMPPFSIQTWTLVLVIAKLNHLQQAVQQIMLGVAHNANAQLALEDVDHHTSLKKLSNRRKIIIKDQTLPINSETKFWTSKQLSLIFFWRRKPSKNVEKLNF